MSRRRAERVLPPQHHVREAHLTGPVACHGLHGEHGDARPARLEQEEVQAGTPARGHDQLVGDVRIVYEELAAGDPAARLTRERDRLIVDRRAFLGERERADAVAAGQGWQVPLALRSAAGSGDERGGHHRALRVRARKARASHLLEEEGHVDHGAAAATIFRGNEEAGPSQHGDLLPELLGEAALARHALRHDGGWALATKKVARGADEELLVGCEVEIHAR